MNLLNYSLTALIAYSGLFAGIILAVIAREELKQGKKYFILLRKLLLLLAFVFLLAYLGLTPLIALLILLFMAVLLIRRKKRFDEQPYIYIILSAVFYLSSGNLALFSIQSSLIFLYGLPTGTLASGSASKKQAKQALVSVLKNIGFIAAAILLYLVF
ncbi:hypothetical protein KY358_00245 [Candidatus Woesearchaeota archaeon]|nr:hypothetical protein [Candidatus Woesearchaeota archaeon]